MGAKISLNQFVRREDRIIWKTIEGKGFLLNLENGSYFEVNDVGLTIWEKCDGKTPLGEIASSLEKKFSLGSKRAADDISEFVGALKSYKVISILDEPADDLEKPTSLNYFN